MSLLVGAVVALDLRLLGAWRAVAIGPLWRVHSGTAAFGLGVTVATGTLLFATRAAEYLASPLFLGKLALVAIACGNALLLRWFAGPDGAGMLTGCTARWAASLSLTAWCLALVAGHLAAYF